MCIFLFIFSSFNYQNGFGRRPPFRKSLATNQRREFSIITYVIIYLVYLIKVHLHTAIRRLRLVFWRIQSSRHASICSAYKISPQFRFLELWHQMNLIHQNPNRTGRIAMCKRPFSNSKLMVG
jgi:hypothetical protein